MWCYYSGERSCGSLVQPSFPMVNGSSDQRIDLLATPDPILVILAMSVDVVVHRRSH